VAVVRAAYALVRGAGTTRVVDAGWDAGRAEIDAAVVDAAVLVGTIDIDDDAGAARELIGSMTGRGPPLLRGPALVRSAIGVVSAELMPTATTAHPATANDAAAPATTRPTAMGSVCQVWLL
jgi:hypothetical protein